jgi:hypothetical protein
MANGQRVAETLIDVIRNKLDCGEDRISDHPAPYAWGWWPRGPSFQDSLFSDYGILNEDKDTTIQALEAEYWEEVTAIHDALDELELEPTVASWRSSDENEPAGIKSLRQRASAIGYWEEIAIPVRRRGEVVYRIIAPRDVMGSPVVSPIPIDFYLLGTAERTGADAKEIAQLRKSVERWQAVAALLGLMIALPIGACIF